MNLVDIKERTNIFTNCSLFFAPCLSALLISCCEYFLITVKLMYSLTFQYFRAILCDRRSASDVTGRDNAYNYFNIKQNTMKKRVHEMELNRSSVQMVLAERFPGYSRASDFNSVISDPQDIMVRGNEESFMEHGFGVAGLNGCRKVACDKF